MQFQSTRPVWGATAACNSVELCGLISIHAPRVGRDSGHHLVRHHPGDFNPRAPCGARLVCLVLERRLHQHFNPRAPCGARPPSPDSIRSWQLFQSTRPVWGATGQRVFLRQRQQFQSTRPVWGATIHVAESVHRANISIHAPRVGRDLPPGILSWPGSISIHAPRVGRDVHGPGHRCGDKVISIHAPRVGRDCKFDDFTPSNLHKRYKRVLARPKNTREKGKIKQKLAYIHAFSAFLGCEGSGTFCALVLRTQYR